MKKFKILVSTIANAQALYRAAERQEYDIDLQSGRHVVDAKSVMGIYALNLSIPITMICYSEDTASLERELGSIIVEAEKEFTDE